MARIITILALMRSIKYRPEIDGLRAIAVIPVILFHLGASWLPGGFAGVDVFFVISGYLITSIIAKEQQEGKFTFAAFWTRRAKRILPVLLAVTFTTLFASYFVGYRNVASSDGLQALSALFSVSNIYMWQRGGDYWGPGVDSLSFLHCWSLSVEEQFYIFYPFLLVWLLQKKKQFLFPILGTTVVFSFITFAVLSHVKPSAAFYLLPTRIWELGAGCLLALLSLRIEINSSRWTSQFLSALGLILILVSYFFLQGESTNIKLLFPVLGAVLFIGYSHSKSALGRMLSLPPIVYIGSISFSLYLWHWPVIVLARQVEPAIMESLFGWTLLVVLTFLLSIFSYHSIESPLRRSPKTLKLLPVGFAACLLMVGIVKASFNDLGNAYDTSAFNRVVFLLNQYDIRPERELNSSQRVRFYGMDIGNKISGHEKAYAEQGLVKRYGKETPDVLVIGDSHGVMWSGVIDDVCREEHLTVSFFASAGVTPFVTLPIGSNKESVKGFTAQQKNQFDTSRLECIKKWKPLVILSTRWRYNYDIEKMRDLIEYIGRAGSKVILIEQPPELAMGYNNSAQFLTYRGYKPSAEGQRQLFPQADQEEVAQGRAFVQQLAQKYPFCSILKTYDYYAPNEKEAYVINGRNILWVDGNHLSNQGTFLIRSRFVKAISDQIAARNSTNMKIN